MWQWVSLKTLKKNKINGKEHATLNNNDTDTPLEISYISRVDADREHSLKITAQVRFIFIGRC